MKIISIQSLAIPDVKVIRNARFTDTRGYFTEVIRGEDLAKIKEIPYFADVTWAQVNQSYSLANVVRGLHFQWNPHQGKLIRATEGRLIDLALDIREGSPTKGTVVAYELHYDPAEAFQDMVWVPPGFAHGFAAVTDCRMEYLCTSTWSPTSERAISIFDPEIDWSLVDPELKQQIDTILPIAHMADKDRNGLTLAQWRSSPDQRVFTETLPQ
jgi:dTDP-4-dehydrorhamnose 3,5-epimerase